MSTRSWQCTRNISRVTSASQSRLFCECRARAAIVLECCPSLRLIPTNRLLTPSCNVPEAIEQIRNAPVLIVPEIILLAAVCLLFLVGAFSVGYAGEARPG